MAAVIKVAGKYIRCGDILILLTFFFVNVSFSLVTDNVGVS